MKSRLTTALITCTIAASAQQTRHITLVWDSPANEPSRSGSVTTKPTFEGARLDTERGDLPFYHASIELPAATDRFSVRVVNATAAPLTGAERSAWGTLQSAGVQPELHTALTWYRKAPIGLLELYPYRKNALTGQLEKLLSFDLLITAESDGRGQTRSDRDYPEHSKLSTGQWYRFTVDADGIYELDHVFLQSLGVNMSGLASDQINIYGDHKGQLPYSNAQADLRPSDLRPCAIRVEDGGDGTFDSGDRILFHGTGPHRWVLAQAQGAFGHFNHDYSKTSSYFIGLGVDPPVRIQDQNLTTDPATHQVTAFDDRQYLEEDDRNLIKSGREFYGDVFDLVDVYNYSFTLPFLRSDSPTRIVFAGMSRTPYDTSISSDFIVSVGGLGSTTISIPGVGTGFTGAYARAGSDTLVINTSQSTLPITVTYDPYDPVTCIGWTDFLEVNGRRDLKFTGDQLLFRDLASIGSGNVSEFTLDNAGPVHRIWEITDPWNITNLPFTGSGAQKTFRLHTDSLREFIAFRNDNYLTPVAVGAVAQQDLHGIVLPADLVIVCPPEFAGEAQRLIDRRTDEGLAVHMVTPQQVFNEFSSGTRDATAIKRFMRMLYDKADNDTTMFPRYLLLFGDGSYDNWNTASNNQNWVPTYQTANSVNLSTSYTSDDYFGLMDPGEGEATSDMVDIGVGRLPVSNLQQARDAVNKLLAYDRLGIWDNAGFTCATGGDGGAGDWRNWVAFVTDDQEGDNVEGSIHMWQTDTLARRVEKWHPDYNVAKIYLDAYQQFSTPGGERYPDAQAAIRDRVQKGALIVNYVGHGGEVGWAHERILDNPTIMDWSNFERLPLFMTATCEFSRWDDPARTSAGEYVFLNPVGGGIALMSTTRLAYSNQNFELSKDFYEHALLTEDEQGRAQRFGDIYRKTKRQITTAQPSQTNHRNFSLLGDPSCRLAMPRMHVFTTSITDTLGNAIDTLQALATVRVTGMVTDLDSVLMSDFDGVVIPTVFDKRSNLSALLNDGGNVFNFTARKNIIYRGKATVTDGAFTFTFVVPQDIAYQVGPGWISYYAESGTTNANGYDDDPLVGGAAAGITNDDDGPVIDLFMNDENFVQGGITDETPLIYAKLFDPNGINTTGNSIGHDITAVIDAGTENELVLNDYYEADLDTWKSGKVRYRLGTLAEGSHTLTLKAWDTHNNSSKSTTEFVVANSEDLALDHVLNYPNPFTTRTEFYFEHNRPCTDLAVQVQVFTVSGRLVKTINRRLTCEGFRAEPLAWDGLDDSGDKLGRGVYVYRLHVTADDGDKAERFEKLVILR